MPQAGYSTLVNYHSVTEGAVPSASNLVQGELAVNTEDCAIYSKNLAGVVVAVGGASTSGFFQHASTISVNQTINPIMNALSAGPMTINPGVTVTIPSTSTWVIASNN